MALGARPVDILRLVLGESMTLTCWGSGFGLVASIRGNACHEDSTLRITSTDPFTFTSVTLLLCGVACSLPTSRRRATKVDPMTALRYE